MWGNIKWGMWGNMEWYDTCWEILSEACGEYGMVWGNIKWGMWGIEI